MMQHNADVKLIFATGSMYVDEPMRQIYFVAFMIATALVWSAKAWPQEPETVYDPATDQQVELIEIQGQKIMMDPCFYYTVMGSAWLTQAGPANVPREFREGMQIYKNMTLRSCSYWARRGSSAHQYGLGMMYANGDQLKQDASQALFWLELAARTGHRYAILERNALVRQLPETTVSDIQNEADAFKPEQ